MNNPEQTEFRFARLMDLDKKIEECYQRNETFKEKILDLNEKITVSSLLYKVGTSSLAAYLVWKGWGGESPSSLLDDSGNEIPYFMRYLSIPAIAYSYCLFHFLRKNKNQTIKEQSEQLNLIKDVLDEEEKLSLEEQKNE